MTTFSSLNTMILDTWFSLKGWATHPDNNFTGKVSSGISDKCYVKAYDFDFLQSSSTLVCTLCKYFKKFDTRNKETISLCEQVCIFFF